MNHGIQNENNKNDVISTQDPSIIKQRLFSKVNCNIKLITKLNAEIKRTAFKNN